MKLKNNKIIETRQTDGTLVGREVSRQRRWQLRNPKKAREIWLRFEKSEGRKQWEKEYQKKYKK